MNNIVEDHAGARVGLVASQDACWKKASMRLDIVQRNVLNRDQRLCVTIWVKWVNHAAWTATVWLLLLLWPNVNVPPDRIRDLEVLVSDVRNFSARAWKHGGRVSRVRLDVDRFEWVVVSYFGEGDVPDTVVVVRWTDRANAHANAKPNLDVPNDNILRALGDQASLVAWLHHNCIVKVSDLHILNENVLSVQVDSVGVERESRQSWQTQLMASKILFNVLREAVYWRLAEELAKLCLSPNVTVDFKVMDMSVLHVFDLKMEFRGVIHVHSSPFDVLNLEHVDELGSTSRVPAEPLADPPLVALAVDDARALDLEAVPLFDAPEVE